MSTTLLIVSISIVFLLVFSPTLADIIIYFKINRSKKAGLVQYQVSFLEHYVKLAKSISVLLFSLCYIAVLLLVVTMAFHKKFITSASGLLLTVITGLLSIFIVFLLKSVVKAIKLHIQYSRHESGKRMTFETSTKTLIIEDSKSKRTFRFLNTQVKEMTIHHFSGNSRNPLADYEYLHLILDNQEELLITSLLANTLGLALALTDKDQKITSLYHSYNTLPNNP